MVGSSNVRTSERFAFGPDCTANGPDAVTMASSDPDRFTGSEKTLAAGRTGSRTAWVATSPDKAILSVPGEHADLHLRPRSERDTGKRRERIESVLGVRHGGDHHGAGHQGQGGEKEKMERK